MGLCGSNEGKTKNDGKTKTTNDGKTIIKEHLIKNEDEIEGDGTNKKKLLRGTPPQNSNSIEEKYIYKLINSKTQKTFENEINGKTTIEQLLTDLNLRRDGDFIIEFENKMTISQDEKDLKFEEVFMKIFNSKDKTKIIEMNYKYTGLDIPDNMNDVIKEYIDSNKIIGSLIDNDENYSIITYEKDLGLIKPYYYQKKDNEELINFNSFTAFCNAKGKLYFSGGEKDQTYDPDKSILKYKDFFCIDLAKLDEGKETVKINYLPNLIETRSWHSMIFIPYKYIFIVGGSNTKSVEIYDIETNEIKKENNELNEFRSECTLCLVNSKYLYAFCGFILHQEFNTRIERCNLLKDERIWEIVEVNDKNGLNFKPSFFGICNYRNNNELLLIGCNDNGDENHFDYIYKIGDDKDEIEEYNCNLKEKNSIFKEKFFLPISNEKSVTIPLPIGNEYKIFIFDSSNGEITIQNYEQIS